MDAIPDANWQMTLAGFVLSSLAETPQRERRLLPFTSSSTLRRHWAFVIEKKGEWPCNACKNGVVNNLNNLPEMGS